MVGWWIFPGSPVFFKQEKKRKNPDRTDVKKIALSSDIACRANLRKYHGVKLNTVNLVYKVHSNETEIVPLMSNCPSLMGEDFIS